MAGASRRAARGVGLAGCLATGLLTCLGAATVGQAHLRGAIEPADPTAIGLAARLSLDLEARLGIGETGTETAAPDEQTRLVLGANGRDVRLSGPLTEGAADRLERLLDGHPEAARIHLTSEGGLADEGRAIGRVIAAHGLSTYVPDYCVSACTLAFVRGRERHILTVARLGFHGPYEEGVSGEVRPADSGPERAAYIAAGVSAGFVEAALAVSPDDLWIPDPERLIEAGVVTAVVDTRRYPDSTLDDGDDLEHARAAVLRNLAVLRGLATRAPQVVDAIAAWYRDAYREGRSEGEAAEGLKALAGRALARAAHGADDAGLVALGRSLLRAMDRADPETCARIGAQGSLVLAEEALRSRTRRWQRGDAADAARRVAALDGAAVEPEAVGPSLDAAHGSLAIGTCASVRAAFAEALAQPARQAATALQGLIDPVSVQRATREASARP